MRQLVWVLLLLSLSTLADTRFTPYADYLYRIWSVEAGLPQISVQTMVQDADGFIWLGTQNGLARFDGVQFDVFNTANSPNLPSNLITSLLIDAKQQLWVGTANGLVKRVAQQFETVSGGRIGNVNTLLETVEGQVWVGADQLYQVVNNELLPISEHQGEVFSLLQSPKGLWVGGNNGVGLFTSASQYQWFSAAETATAIQFHELGFYNDTLWLGSQLGLFQLTPDASWLPVHLPDVASLRIELIFTDQQDGLWISTLNKLFRWHNGQLVEQIDLPEQQDFSWVESMMQDAHGNLWLGSRSHGVKRLRTAVTERYGREAGITDLYTWGVHPWQDNLLVGSRQGVELFDPSTQRYQLKITGEQLANPFVYSFFADNAKRLWVGTRSGVSVFDEASLSPLFQVPELAHLLVTSFAEQDDRLWLGTNGGLYYIDQIPDGEPAQLSKSVDVKVYEHPALPSDVRVRSIYPDKEGQLWIGTEVGLFVLDQQQQLQAVKDAILSKSFITKVFALPDNQLFIGTFDQGFSIGQQGNWQHFNQQSGLPGNGVIHAELYEDLLLISNFEGVYRLNYTALRTGQISELYLLIDDRRPDGASDSHRCCNGAGDSKGALLAGRLWFPTLNGIVGVNLQKVRETAALPQPVITGLTINNTLYYGEKLTLATEQRDWQLSFSAPYFVQAPSLQFRYQLRGYDDAWIYAGNRRDAFYTNLAPGHYQFSVQVKAAADYRWSDSTFISIDLPARWYETKWFIFFVFNAVLLLLWAIYQLRVSALDKSQRRLQQLVDERTAALHQANQRLQQMSMEDALTGLYNRHYLSQHIEPMLARSKRKQQPLVWVLIDIDHFKQINDVYGHQVGDAALKQVALILTENSRSSDHILRWGGEEFLLVLEESVNTQLYLERLQQAFATQNWQQLGLAHPLTCSVGAIHQPAQLNWETCLQLADLALYQVKQQGRNGYLLLYPTADYPTVQQPEITSLAQLIKQGWLTWQSNTVQFE
ncbi:ligand-binding sensor domain-containing diguanylate cyclase [Alishewanella tabrizica]|uniref:diguanylate cyclase n=1 Tax=Alishewanella tabrizica TaxID=671278 RepID=A0ABQ2WV12_9ALTE|nr:ligand-binding sensor domain-containing diguanylate cyclase [Alishewanella tabrizica]GGW69664.1 GGDEF domain-containing protein [Alishewanella tabrizica]